MLKLSILALSLISTLAFASNAEHNVKIDSQNLSGSFPLGTKIDNNQSGPFTAEVPYGSKMVAFSEDNFRGVKKEYTNGVHEYIQAQSFTVEQYIDTAFRMIYMNLERNPAECLDVTYQDKQHNKVNITKLCHGEITPIFLSAPYPYKAGDRINFTIWRDGKPGVEGNLYVQPGGALSLLDIPRTYGMRADPQGLNFLRIGATRPSRP